MNIVYLADHPQYVTTVSKWILGEWGHDTPGTTQESIEKKFRTHLNRVAIPLTLLGMVENRPVGTASLVFHDMKDRPELSPWLAAVYVLPEFRGQGIGSKLVTSIELLSADLGVELLYLFTPNKDAFYARMGWSVLERTVFRAKPVVIMSKPV